MTNEITGIGANPRACDAPRESGDRQKGRAADLRHRTVPFRLADIHFPEPGQVAVKLHDGERTEGVVIDRSDPVNDRAAFAMIQIARLDQVILVPVDRLQLVTEL